jgi:predicted dinucleotide-binding enzyme
MSYAIIGFGKIDHALAKSFARKGIEVSNAERLFAVFGLVAAEPAQGS